MKIKVIGKTEVKYYYPETIEEFLSIKISKGERMVVSTRLQKDMCKRILLIKKKLKNGKY